MPWVAVFDTNVLISALLSLRGNPFRCIALARLGAVESVTCQDILDEFREKLEAKFLYPPERADAAADDIRRISRSVTITNTLRVIDADPKDDKIIECAVVGEASHIVTGDRHHLQPLKSYQGIHIVSPAEFLVLHRSNDPAV